MDARDDCKKAAGVVQPVINRGDCEGKRDCEKVCPYQVFEVRTIDDPGGHSRSPASLLAP